MGYLLGSNVAHDFLVALVHLILLVPEPFRGSDRRMSSLVDTKRELMSCLLSSASFDSLLGVVEPWRICDVHSWSVEACINEVSYLTCLQYGEDRATIHRSSCRFTKS